MTNEFLVLCGLIWCACEWTSSHDSPALSSLYSHSSICSAPAAVSMTMRVVQRSSTTSSPPSHLSHLSSLPRPPSQATIHFTWPSLTGRLDCEGHAPATFCHTFAVASKRQARSRKSQGLSEPVPYVNPLLPPSDVCIRMCLSSLF